MDQPGLASFAEDMNGCFSIPDMATSQVGSHLLELIMNLSTPQMLEEMHAALFKGRLLHYAIHPIANYVLQGFMSSLKEKALVSIFYEIYLKYLILNYLVVSQSL